MLSPLTRVAAVTTAAALALSLLTAVPAAADDDDSTPPGGEDAQGANEEFDALALAEQTGEPVEIPSLTDEKTRHFANPDGTWNVGPQTGDFSWTYPMAAPNTAGGLQPDISLSYSSQSVDGRVSDTNNQTSWIGEGFDYHPGYIERRYITCQDDDTDIPDQCWSHHNATLNLGGRSTELVYDDGEWTPPQRRRLQGRAADRHHQRRQRRRALEGHHHRRHPVLLRPQPPARPLLRRRGDRLGLDGAGLRQRLR
jgi:hypothetical protein